MRALFCIICPPFAVLLCGRPISALFNMFLCLFFWMPGVAHAFAVHNDTHISKQTKRIVNAITKKGKHKPKKKKACPVHNEARMKRLFSAEAGTYDDKFIGEGGTKFKRKP